MGTKITVERLYNSQWIKLVKLVAEDYTDGTTVERCYDKASLIHLIDEAA